MTAIENIQAKVREAQKEQAEWLEDVLAGLLCNGVQREEINVQYFISDPGLTRVTVRGVPKYEHRVILLARGNPGVQAGEEARSSVARYTDG